jgi:hypothetical protein
MRSPEDSPTFSATMSALSSPLLSAGGDSVKSQRLFSLQTLDKGSLRLSSQRLNEQHDGSGDYNNFPEFKVPPPPTTTTLMKVREAKPFIAIRFTIIHS